MNASFEAPKEGRTAFAKQTRCLDLVHLARMTLGDRSLEAEVLGLFLRQSGTLAERAANAEGAELAALAHTLKGSARAVGAWRVAECAERLETSARAGASAHNIALAELGQAVKEVRTVIAGILQPA